MLLPIAVKFELEIWRYYFSGKIVDFYWYQRVKVRKHLFYLYPPTHPPKKEKQSYYDMHISDLLLPLSLSSLCFQKVEIPQTILLEDPVLNLWQYRFDFSSIQRFRSISLCVCSFKLISFIQWWTNFKRLIMGLQSKLVQYVFHWLPLRNIHLRRIFIWSQEDCWLGIKTCIL